MKQIIKQKLAHKVHANQAKIFAHPSRFKIVAAGRRFGKTEGLAIAMSDLQMQTYTQGYHRALWVDVTLAKAREYVERTIEPLFADFPVGYLHHHQTKHVLSFGEKGTLNYYGADEPRNVEGSKMHNVVINEAGIVFRQRNGRYLWQNALRPMIMDTEGTAMIAGTPKGKMALDGKPSMFYELFSRSATIITANGEIPNPHCKEPNSNYQSFQFSTYDNPYLIASEIEETLNEVPAAVRRQEIFGEFIDETEDSIFKREWWRRFVQLADGSKVHSWDMAVKKGEKNDYTACSMWNITNDFYVQQRYQMYDLWMRRALPSETMQAIKDLAARDKPAAILIEDKSAGEVFVPMLRSETRLPIVPIMPIGDKRQRALKASIAVQAGKVELPHDAAWVADFINRAEVFDGLGGSHDDDIDSVTQFINWIALVPKRQEVSTPVAYQSKNDFSNF